jgi:hypothetical protein
VRRLAAALALSVGLVGCGLNVQSPDLFLLTRTGEGKPLTLLVNDSGTIRCNGEKARPLSDPLLLQARDLETNLDADAVSKVRFAPPAPNSVFTYSVRLQDGTLRFPDTAAAHNTDLAQTEQFTVEAAQQACGLSG